jgi:hypothetical protein
MSTIEDIKGYSAYKLAALADVFCPDSDESEGARLLSSVRDSVIERVEYLIETDELSLEDAVEEIRDGDALGEIADGAPSVYTHRLWTEFLDLGGYREDLSDHDLTVGADNLERVPSLALYLIAWRLADLLLDELAE